MRLALRVFGVVLAAALLLAMSWASSAPLNLSRTGNAILRISLGARPERIETCRAQTNEDLAKLAPQMRQTVICEGATAKYLLEVRRNNSLIYSRALRGGGLRHDRQLYLSHDLYVPPGPAAFAVHMVRMDTVPAGKEIDEDAHVENADEEGILRGRTTREVEERRRRREEAVPSDLGLEVAATLKPGEVLLVSYDAENRLLISRRDSRR